jgi:hypothetical protein
MARWIDSWLPGSPAGPDARAAGAYPGERFGLPESGVSSVAGLGRRFVALAIDWLLGYLIASLLAGPDPLANPTFNWYVLGVWFLITAVPVAVFGASAGKVALGIRVAPGRGARRPTGARSVHDRSSPPAAAFDTGAQGQAAGVAPVAADVEAAAQVRFRSGLVLSDWPDGYGDRSLVGAVVATASGGSRRR